MPSDIAEFVMHQPLFDQHDHHVGFEEFARRAWTADDLIGYAGGDLFTAAGPRPGPHEDPSQLDGLFPQYVSSGLGESLWPRIRNTGYARAVSLGCRELFGLDYIPGNWPDIQEALGDLVRSIPPAELYDEWVGRRSNIRWVIEDDLQAGQRVRADQFPDWYRFTLRWDALFSPAGPQTIRAVEQRSGRSVHSPAEMAAAVQAVLDEAIASGKLAGMKIGMAYQRDLAVAEPSEREADEAFRKVAAGPSDARPVGAPDHPGRPLGDWLFHRVMARADAEDLPVQVHTGYLAGIWHSPERARAALLVPVFRKYRRVRFDVFHGSFPYTSELGALAKNFPNVWPDLCWTWAMSPAAAQWALAEWLDEVPYTRIFAFGSDTFFPACTVGYTLQARAAIAGVLERKVAEGAFDVPLAREVASAIMLDNGRRFFALDGQAPRP